MDGQKWKIGTKVGSKVTNRTKGIFENAIVSMELPNRHIIYDCTHVHPFSKMNAGHWVSWGHRMFTIRTVFVILSFCKRTLMFHSLLSSASFIDLSIFVYLNTCPAYVIKVLVYWYQEQRLCVKWDGMASDAFSVCNGIKQGGILSPKLFNIYVDVLSQQLNKVMVGCCMNGKVINHLYYADDLVLLSPSTHGMQKLLNECEKYASKYGMKFNENKSVVLNFKGHRFKANPSAKLYLNGSLMKTAVSYTYLGHIINNNLNDNKDIERQLRNFYGKSNMLLRTFGSCSYAVKLQLFMSYCGSMYTAFLWCDFTQRKYRQLEVAYNNVFRRFLGYDKYCSASSMFVENRTDGFDARIRKLVYGFRERLQISENSLIETIINSSAWRSSRLLNLWEKYLYLP